MPFKPDEPVFPIAGWTIVPVSAHGVILFRPSFLTHPMQRPEEANRGRIYALNMAQARQLVSEIDKLFRYLESIGAPRVPPDEPVQ